MKTLRCVLLVLLLFTLTACQAGWVANLVTPSGGRLYWDEFSDPSSGWAIGSSQNGAVGYSAGAYRITVISPNYQIWAVSHQSFLDVRLQVVATRIAGPLASMYGLICYYQDPGHFDFFIVSSDGYYSIGRMKNGTISLLGQNEMAYSSAITSQTNSLSFECAGSTLTGSVNGKVLAIAQQTDFTGGDAGLIAGTFEQGGVDVRFQHFTVYKP
jgi:hypothetical protein